MGIAGFERGSCHQIGHVGKHSESRLLSKVLGSTLDVSGVLGLGSGSVLGLVF